MNPIEYERHKEQMEAARRDFGLFWDANVKVFNQFFVTTDPKMADRAMKAAQHIAWNSFLFGIGISRRNNRIADSGKIE